MGNNVFQQWCEWWTTFNWAVTQSNENLWSAHSHESGQWKMDYAKKMFFWEVIIPGGADILEAETDDDVKKQCFVTCSI